MYRTYWKNPTENRKTGNEVRPFIQNWEAETKLHKTICVGTQTSLPRRLLISCEGNSATEIIRRDVNRKSVTCWHETMGERAFVLRKLARKRVLPRL